MAGDDIVRIREAYRLMHRGDPREILDYIDPEAKWEPAAHTPRRPAEDGHDLAKRLVWRGTVHKLKITEALDLGPQVLVALSGRRMHFMGAGFFSRSIYQLVTLRNGRIVRLQDFKTREEALAAAGQPL